MVVEQMNIMITVMGNSAKRGLLQNFLPRSFAALFLQPYLSLTDGATCRLIWL